MTAVSKRKYQLFWEPARPPYTEGDVLVYATQFRPDGEPDRFATWWFVTVIEPEVCLIGARKKVVRVQERKEDGAPRTCSIYRPINHLFREVRP